MKPYINTMHQVVSEDWLAAILDHISDTCHRYCIDRITERFCYVRYTNPDEYGRECPITAMLPVYRSDPGNTGIICVVLDLYNVIGGRDEADRYVFADCFTHWVSDHHPLARDPIDGKWKTPLEVSLNVLDVMKRRGSSGSVA